MQVYFVEIIFKTLKWKYYSSVGMILSITLNTRRHTDRFYIQSKGTLFEKDSLYVKIL